MKLKSISFIIVFIFLFYFLLPSLIFSQVYFGKISPIKKTIIDLKQKSIESSTGTLATDSFELLWTYNEGGRTPGIGSDGSMYFGSDRNLLKLSAVTSQGARLWEVLFSSQIITGCLIGPDDTVYAGAWDNKLYALSSTNGSKKWEKQLEETPFQTPAISSGGIIYQPAGNVLYAIDAANGTELWKYNGGPTIRTSPAIDSSGTVYFGNSDGHLYAVNPDSSTKWIYITPSSSPIFSSPAIGSDGTIYFGCNDNIFYAIDAANGTKKWGYLTGDINCGPPVIGVDGTIYFGSNDNKLYAINPDGTLKWSYLTNDDIVCAPIIDSLGVIYFSAEDRIMRAINPDGTKKWDCTDFSIGFYGQNSHPAMSSDGILYVSCGSGVLYAVDVTTGTLADSTWPKYQHDNQNTGRME